MMVGIHQPNFVPHFGFFYKMSMCDIFVVLEQVQFEKGGYQNRYFLQDKQKWVTMPVGRGLVPLHRKTYANGIPLARLNMDFIFWACGVLNIETPIKRDVCTNGRGTQRILDNLNYYGASAYVTNPSAKDKYLDEGLIRNAGIDIIYCEHPNAKYNILEMFEKFGIEGTRKQLYHKPAPLVKRTEESDGKS